MYVVPLTNSPNQKFSCTIPVDGKSITLNFFLTYNSQAGYWTMDLYDTKQNPIIVSIPLLCGLNLLEQNSYLNIGSAYICKTDSTLASNKPDSSNLGTIYLLMWSDTIASFA